MQTEIDYDLMKKTKVVEKLVSKNENFYSLVDLQDIGFTERGAINKIQNLTKNMGFNSNYLMDAYYETDGTLHLIVVDIKEKQIKKNITFNDDEWAFKEELSDDYIEGD